MVCDHGLPQSPAGQEYFTVALVIRGIVIVLLFAVSIEASSTGKFCNRARVV